MPPKPAQTAPPFWSTKLNNQNFAAATAKFPIALQPDKQSKQKLFFDCYQQICTAFNIAPLPCFKLHPITSTTSIIIHSAEIDIPNSLAIGQAITESQDVQFVRILDCKLYNNTIQNIFHSNSTEKSIYFSLENMTLSQQNLDCILFMSFFSKTSLKFINCEIGAEIGKEISKIPLQNLQFLSIINCSKIDLRQFLGEIYGKNINFSLRGIELFSENQTNLSAEFTQILTRTAGNDFLDVLRQKFQISLFSAEFQNLKFFDPATKKKYEKISQYACQVREFVKQQQGVYQLGELEICGKNHVEGLIETFLGSFEVLESELVDFLGCNCIFDAFDGVDAEFRFVDKLEYVGCTGEVQMVGSLKSFYNGVSVVDKEE